MHFPHRAACVALAASCVMSAAHAALGTTPSPAAALRENVSANVATQSAAGYSISVTSFSDGVVVREYVAPSGIVFGASWSGPALPNLRTLFGGYYAQLQQGANDYRRTHGGLRMIVIDQPDLYVQSGGQPGSFAGRAYLRNTLPAGVTADAIQ